MLKKDETLIPVKKVTRDKLKERGIKGETYDKIITRLLNFFSTTKLNFS